MFAMVMIGAINLLWIAPQMRTAARTSVQFGRTVAIEVVLQPREQTLTDEAIEKVSKAIVAAVVKATGGELRT